MSGSDGMESILECVMPGAHGSYCYVPSWPVLKTDATRGLKRAMPIRNGEPPGMQRPGSPSRVAG
jgi:hypothetical protein